VKQILSFLAALITLTLTAKAQIRQADISVTVTSPLNNEVMVPNDTTWLSFIFTNNGPDLLPAGDSLFFVTTGNLIVFSVLSSNLPVGDTIIEENILKLWNNNNTNDTVTREFCIFHIPQSLATYVNGSHPVTTYEDANKLNDTSCVIVKMTPLSGTSIDNAVAQKQPFELFPNPVKDQLFVTPLEANKNIKCSIINALGQTVWQQTLHSGISKHLKIDVTTLPAGVFYFRQNLDGSNASVKFIK